MAVITAREIIRRSLRNIGAVAVGQGMPGEAERDALSDLNELLESWSLNNIRVVADSEESFALTTSKAAYTIGNLTGKHTGADNVAILTDKNLALEVNAYVGGTVRNDADGSSGTVTANTATTVTATLAGGTDNNWDTGDPHALRGELNGNRPLSIRDDAVIRDGTTDYPLSVKTIDEYRIEAVKGTTSRPWMLAYQPEFPLGIIYLYPTPDSAYTLKYNSRTALANFTALSTQINLSPGYSEAIISNLAVKLAIPHQKEVSIALGNLADKSLRVIESQNASPIKPVRLEELASLTTGRTRWAGTILTGPQ